MLIGSPAPLTALYRLDVDCGGEAPGGDDQRQDHAHGLSAADR